MDVDWVLLIISLIDVERKIGYWRGIVIALKCGFLSNRLDVGWLFQRVCMVSKFLKMLIFWWFGFGLSWSGCCYH